MLWRFFIWFRITSDLYTHSPSFALLAMDTPTLRTLLQLPFESFYSNRNALDSYIPSSMIVLLLEGILLCIALVQLLRFCYLPNIYLKKIIHVLIACQLIASISQVIDMSKFLGIEYEPYILFSVQESSFMFSGLAFLTVLLFWVDFNWKLRSAGPGISFLQSATFAILVFMFSICYIGAFIALQYYYVADVHEGWKLSFKIIWWHLGFYCFITPVQLYYTYRIYKTLGQYYFTYSHSFDKTKKILQAVNFCFVLRTCSIITFIVLYHYSENTEEVYLATWPAFICFYILDQILPASIFMFLLRKSPKPKLEYLRPDEVSFAPVYRAGNTYVWHPSIQSWFSACTNTDLEFMHCKCL